MTFKYRAEYEGCAEVFEAPSSHQLVEMMRAVERFCNERERGRDTKAMEEYHPEDAVAVAPEGVADNTGEVCGEVCPYVFNGKKMACHLPRGHGHEHRTCGIDGYAGWVTPASIPETGMDTPGEATAQSQSECCQARTQRRDPDTGVPGECKCGMDFDHAGPHKSGCGTFTDEQCVESRLCEAKTKVNVGQPNERIVYCELQEDHKIPHRGMYGDGPYFWKDEEKRDWTQEAAKEVPSGRTGKSAWGRTRDEVQAR